MAEIKVLSAEIANRIAAGEVVDRPASVLKELVDNAIDAGATRIIVRTEKAGTSLIEVSDNGSGMNQSNALLCLEQHATSKISDASDLDAITSYGFRGEALPSIASISRFTIITRRHEDLEGSLIQVDGGEIKTVEAIGSAPGTTMKVAKLFYNVPARKKFLKSERTEDFHIQETFTQLALSRQDIHMELYCDGRCVYNIPPSKDINTRLKPFVTRDTLKNMLDVNYEEAGIKVSGLCSRPGLSRGNSKEQRFFINRRPIVAPEINRAVRNSYEGLIAKGQFAPCVLHIEIDPKRIDINVHPAKREVRFREGNLISQVVTHAISLSLRQLSGEQSQLVAPAFLNPQAQVAPSEVKISLPDTDEAKPKFIHQTENIDPMETIVRQRPVEPNFIKGREEVDPLETIILNRNNLQKQETQTPEENTRVIEVPSKTVELAPPQKESFNHGFDELKMLSFFNSKYLLCEGENGLLVVSLKAARERILFEQMLHNWKQNQNYCQDLLIPINVELNQTDSHLVEKYQAQLADLGFSVRFFGGQTWLIDSTPLSFPADNTLGTFQDLLDIMHSQADSLKKDAHLKLAKGICKASSIRINFDERSAREILKDLNKCESPYSCPQGKPIFINISENELLKRFGRNS